MQAQTSPALLSPEPKALLIVAERLAIHAQAIVPDASEIRIAFEAPRHREFGDFATNIAFGLARTAREAPQRLAERIVERAQHDATLTGYLSELTALAGFINLRLAADCWHGMLIEMLRKGAAFGRDRLAGSERISLEFGSANPTGPLVVVQGRSLSIGDTLARTLRFCGVPVTTEWIVNDAGNQLETFARSIYARYRQMSDPTYPFPEEGYPGEYVAPIAAALRERDGDRWERAEESAWLSIFADFGRDRIVTEQRAVCERFRVMTDHWQSERDLHEQGAVERGIEHLRGQGHIYDKEGATWFAATHFGDDKDRVVRRSDGRPTYYAGDVAYHHDKYLRGAQRIIDILGPDHHGYIGRLTALAAALEHPGTLEVLIAQQMTLMRGAEEVSLSKRSGTILTLAEVIDEVGVDAARFFFIQISSDSPLTFDLELAKRTNDENPVYAVQYGHARIASLLRRATPEDIAAAQGGEGVAHLTERSELSLIARLSELPQVVVASATLRATHRLARYARDVASDFHHFYAAHRILGDDQELRRGRLALALATQRTLAVLLDLMGVSAPDEMASTVAVEFNSSAE